ncbi:MAG: hypothetical protein KF861_14270 [Planctomycetaceae bacterium]|nr:hypothetical protein [Planctomycetaceae bacterium]
MARSKRRSNRWDLRLVVLVISLAAPVRADDVDQAAASPEAAPSADEPVNVLPQRVIVLSTGRVILGDVVERPGGYLVREQFGSVVVPFTQVLLTATDLPDAYRKFSQSLKNPTAGTHLSLAKWCFENRLYAPAQIEVKQALLLEPDRKEARDFLKKLQRTMETGVHPSDVVPGSNAIDATQEADAAGQPWRAYSQRRKMLAPTEDSVSVSGLSPATVEMFVQQVQPLMMNKCGNARCHGQAATNEFRLTPCRQGMSGFRILTEKNLSAAVREVEAQSPETSRLLSALRNNHGGTGSVFTGPAADKQKAVLREWVIRAAAERTTTDVASRPKPVVPAETQTASKPGPQRDPFLQEILAEERPDAFDPEVFNRLVHKSVGR